MMIGMFHLGVVMGGMLGLALGEGNVLGPDPSSDLVMEAPIARWDEALPLGQGLLGGLLWGGEHTLKLSLDRGDLWDLRRPDIVKQPDWNYGTIRKLVGEKNQAEISRLFDVPYDKIPNPTKLPVGRIEMKFADQEVKRFSLNLREAVGEVALDKGQVRVFFSAMQPVALIQVTGAVPQFGIVPPSAVKQLGFPPAEVVQEPGWVSYVQAASEGMRYAVVAGYVTKGDTTLAGLTVALLKEGAGIEEARKTVQSALDAGFDAMLGEHRAWWAKFWGESSVHVPDGAIQRQYDLVQYFYGAASRRGAPPMPLQGVWTADDGTLPPWKGDYHHDLNTQLTYWAYLAAGHNEEGASFLDFMWNLLPEHRDFAKTFYGTGGAAVPGVMTLDGKALGGWSQYSLSPTNGAWVAQAFYLHWRYTMDEAFLRDRAYPYLSALAECYEGLLTPDASGKLKLPLSSSPEIHDNRLEAWLAPNSNYDLALLRWHFGALGEMADALKDEQGASHWRAVLGKLDDFAVEADTGALRLSLVESLTESHRHHSQLMAIHPLGLVTAEGSDLERKIIEGSLAQVEGLGTRNWCGYSFSWMSCMMARTGHADKALSYLQIFVDAFLSRNGFHINGDQLGGKHSNFTYRPFTLEGNFAAAQAVHEMLLQSWGGMVRVFPSVPEGWSDVSFERLRAEGGFEVTAVRKGGQTEQVRVLASHGGVLRLRNPFGASPATWNRTVETSGSEVVCPLTAGAYLEGKLTR